MGELHRPCPSRMPEISRFYGLVIRMYFVDHNPPHFHVRFGGSKGVVRLSPIELLAGNLPSRALALTLEWASIHEAEILANWARLRNRLPPVPIAPLE